MPALTLLCLGLAVLVTPAPSRSLARLRRLARSPGPGGTTGPGSRLPAPRQAVVLVLCGLGGAGLGIFGSMLVVPPGRPTLVAAIAVGLVGAVIGHVGKAEAESRREDRAAAALAAAVGCLAEALRAGQAPPAALRAASGVAGTPDVASAFRRAAAVADAGGDVPVVLRTVGRASATARGLHRLAAGWAVSERCGAGLAGVLDRIEADIGAERRRQRQVSAELAGPRATAMLLAGLPVFGLLLGNAVGARPVAVLLGTPPGEAALLAGVCLHAAGVAWTAAIVRSAAGAS